MQNHKTLMGIILASLLVAGVIAGYFLVSGGNQDAPTTDTRQAEQRPAQEDDSNKPADDAEEAAVKEFNITAGNYLFNPAEIRVKKGDRVKIVLSVRDTAHAFTIDELRVSIPMTSPGRVASTEFTAHQAGEFTYYCSVSNHRQLGQTGKLIVE